MQEHTTQTPSTEHAEFDRMCSVLDEFEPLPAVSSPVLEHDEDGEENTSLDGQILAGLVSPAY
jgi:hypothetical protein